MLFLTDQFLGQTRAHQVPDSGLVVVQGENGAGKSTSFVEAFAYALFGQTTREVLPEHPARATVEIGALRVERLRGKRETAVSWSVGGVAQGTAEGASKAQPRINKFLGLDFETWQQTCVFSIEKIARFTSAKDSERKALLERLLGLQRFDAALQLVRDEKNALVQKRRVLAAKIEGAQRAYDLAVKTAVDYEAATEWIGSSAGEPVPELAQRLAQWKSALKDRRSQHEAMVECTRIARRIASEALGGLVAARQAVQGTAAAVNGLVCEACGREFDTSEEQSAHLEAAHDKAVNALALAQTMHTSASEKQRFCETAEMGKLKEIKEAEEAIRTLEWNIAEEQRRDQEAARMEEHLGVLQQQVAERAEELAELTNVSRAEGRKADEIAGAEAVLGLKGARARLMVRGLEDLEASTNASLADMLVPARVMLGAARAKTDGTMTDEIHIGVTPWGGGNGYKGCSGGERKRIDLAMLTGITRMYVSPPALGAQLPLVFDDVFDTLSPKSVDAVAALLTGLSRQRTVIVITQNEAFADKLPAASRFDL